MPIDSEKDLALHPLTSYQRDIWIDQCLYPDKPIYNIGGYVEIHGEFDCQTFQRAIDQFIADNSALRVRVIDKEENLYQRILPEITYQIPFYDFSGCENPPKLSLDWMEKEFIKPFDYKGNLFQFALLKKSKEGHCWFGKAHHLILDGWGFSILVRQIIDNYNKLVEGTLDWEIKPSYTDFILEDQDYLLSKKYRKDIEFWRSKYRRIPEPLLNIKVENYGIFGNAISSGRKTLTVKRHLYNEITEFCEARRCSIFHFIIGVLFLYFSRVYNKEEIIAGVPILNRGKDKYKKMIGHFANQIPLKISPDGEITFQELLNQIKNELRECYRHHKLSFGEIYRTVYDQVNDKGNMFELTLSYEKHDYQVSFVGTKSSVLTLTHRNEMKALSIYVREFTTDRDVDIDFDYQFAVFDKFFPIENVIGHFEFLLSAVMENSHIHIHDIRIVPNSEKRKLLYEFNPTEADYPKDKCVHQLFEAQAEKAPDAMAVLCEDQSITYKELNERANRLAHRLIALGVKPDTRVAIGIERNIDMVVGLLGILKAGGAYVPLDPTHPMERHRFMLEDSAPLALLTQASLKEHWGKLPDGVTLIEIDSASINWEKFSSVNPDPRELKISSSDLAYIIYTSGSTGNPKGVMVEHKGVCNQICVLRDIYSLDHESRILQFASVTFDMSVEEIFPALGFGAALVLRTSRWLSSHGDFFQQCAAHNITHLNLPCAFWQQLAADESVTFPPSIRQVSVGGDAITAVHLKKWFDKSPKPRLFNAYGPTEATVNATIGELSPGIGSWRSIGRPIANTRMYVLDAYGKPVPIGVSGELYIGGVQVARGYLNRPKLTAEKFLPDPFVVSTDGGPQARMYKTGDLGRFLPDGTIEFIGRNDFQVKIRGFRIELGEIETRLANIPGIKEAVVHAREDSSGEKRLAAYFIGSDDLRAQTLRSELSKELPEYMIPAAYVRLKALPLTPNGKLDRKALPIPEVDAFSARTYEAPVGEVEETLARIWSELLKLDRIGRYDHFFELGGHSLLAVSLISRMARQGLHADVRALFTNPTLASLAVAVRGQAPLAMQVPQNRIPAGCLHITPDLLPLVTLTQPEIDRIGQSVPGGDANIQDIYPLAPLQEGIFFHHLISQAGDAYLLSLVLALDSRERIDGFLTALEAVIARHDILRTAVLWEGLPEPVQVVYRKARLPVTQVTLSGSDVAQQLRAHIDPRHNRLDIRMAPLIQAFVAEDKHRDGWLLGLLSHHLISDQTTLEMIVEEVRAQLAGETDRLPAALPFRNFVAQARLGVGREAHEAFFQKMLEDVEEPTAPFGILDVKGDGSEITKARLELDSALALALRAQARKMGVSAASLFHLTWAKVLAALCGHADVVFGTVLFGRMQGSEGADQGLGMFINTLPVRIRVGHEPVAQAVKKTHGLLAQLLHHEHAPLTLSQRCSKVSLPAPLFTALFNYRYSQEQALSATRRAAWEGIEIRFEEERTNYPLTFSVDDREQSFLLTAQVQPPIDPARVCEYMRTALTNLVAALKEAPHTCVDTIEVLPESERRQVLFDWNQTQADYPKDRCVQELFETQVDKRPDAVAVVLEDRKLTYAELNRRANRMAHKLIALGIKPDTRVAVGVERSLELVVGLLAILKAGGAYVPLDPAYPDEWLSFILEDSAPHALLTQSALKERWADISQAVTLVEIDSDACKFEAFPATTPAPGKIGLSASHLAYIVYTSGSTGRPKGVMVEHRNLVNLLYWHRKAFQLTCEDYSSSLAGLGFDASTWEIWPPLCTGGTLVLAPQAIAHDPTALLSWWQNQPLAVSFLPTPIAELAFASAVKNTKLRYLLIGGDRLHRMPQFPSGVALINNYGPTETTVVATSGTLNASDKVLHIGRPVANTRIYLLDDAHRLVPIGVTGELYIAGAGVARGYLNRPELTAQRFLPDPFAPKDEFDARMYKTGDLGRFLPDGTIEFLGRNDFQVKIRGVRIELGEIEARLAGVAGIKEVVVLAREDVPGQKRLAAYYTASEELTAETLRSALSRDLPEYMVPAAYMALPALPLTPNGKVDRKALCAPEGEAFGTQAFEAPRGEVEEALAEIWTELLKVEKIGRHDHFFELGGHSLLAVNLISRMRKEGLSADVRALFTTPTLVGLAAAVGAESPALVQVPESRIPEGCEYITPDLLPLVALTQAEIDRIVESVPDGAANIQDIYPLAPLQEGIFFHHLLTQTGDAYLLPAVLAFDSRKRLDDFLAAMEAVIARHDILRTAVLWEDLPEPVQVVLRRAELTVTHMHLTAEPSASEALRELMDPSHRRLDIRKAPLMQAFVAENKAAGRWLLGLLSHHLAIDHTTLEKIIEEVQAHLCGQQDRLPVPLPFRNFVAQAHLGVNKDEHEAFFRRMLKTVEVPTAPFGIMDVLGDGSGIAEARLELENSLAMDLKARARRLAVSAACIFHLAWAMVLARLCSLEEVVFGSLLFGRMQGSTGIDRMLGMFINTLPVCISVGDDSVVQVVKKTHALLAQLLHHEHAPLSLVQRCSHVPPPTPLFTTLLNYRYSQKGDTPDAVAAAWEGIEMLECEERTNYPLCLDVDDLGQGFLLTAQAHPAMDPQRMCGYMRTALTHLLKALDEAPESAVRTIDVLPPTERRQLQLDWNVKVADYPRDLCIHELFEAQAEKTPDAVAVIYEERRLTYAKLNRRANRLARHLVKLGVKPDTRVAICVEKGPEMVVGLLAILKAGGAYVPLDPVFPAQRLRFMFEDSAPLLLLTQNSLMHNWADLFGNKRVGKKRADSIQVIQLDSDAKQWKKRSPANPNPRKLGLSSSHLAYVIYTSGSTGTPKGVMVEHRSLVNYTLAAAELFGLGENDGVLQQNTLTFDLSVEEMFPALISGAALLPSPTLFGMSDAPAGNGIGPTCVHLTAAHWHSLVAEWRRVPETARQHLDTVRLINVTGDRLSSQKLAVWDEIRPPHTRLVNTYGPTEATVSCSAGDVRHEPDRRSVSIGRPLANAPVYILDEHQRPVPIGVAGELYIGGIQVTRGYLNRPELTAERFLPDPFAPTDEVDARMYRTGDLGRWLPDGTIEFLGRSDFQVKIRGFRIELGEIEARLAGIPGIRETAVVAREDVPGDKRLTAYYTADVEFSAEALRSRLASELPDYMLPMAFVPLPALPLLPNGKLDRKALPAPQRHAVSTRSHEPPEGAVEEALADIWAELLKVDSVGRHDHFFELGGHSLLAVTLISRMQAQGLFADVRALFTTPTLAGLAAAVGEKSDFSIEVPANRIPAECRHITPDLLPLVSLTQAEIDRVAAAVLGGAANIQDIYPLAPLQEGIFFHHRVTRTGDVYLEPSVLALDGRGRLDDFLAAMEAVIARHDILRTAVLWEGLPEPVQVVLRKARLAVTEMTLATDNGAEELQARIDPRQNRLDIRKAPLLRVYIAEDKMAGRWLLGLLSHHLAVDHTTLDLIIEEIRAQLSGETQRLTAPLPFRNFVAQARLGVSREAHEAFFRKLLQDVDEPTAPFGLTDVTGDGSGIAQAQLELDHALARELRACAHTLGVSVASICHLAWAMVLARLCERGKVVFGSVLFGRMQASQGADQVLGMFINTLPVAIDVNEDSSAKAVKKTHALLAQLLHHEHAPLILAQGCSAVKSPAPLFTTLFNYRYSRREDVLAVRQTVWEGIEILFGEERTNYPLTLSVDDLGDGFALSALVQTPIDPTHVCEYLRTALTHLTQALSQAPATPVDAIEVLPDAERQKVLFDWNRTRTDYPQDRCIHELFEAQAAANPDAVGVIGGDQSITYAQLNRRANRLAHHLMSQGVRPGDHVAIALKRSIELVIAELAVLKSGAVYVPLDPEHPGERLAFMLRDTGARVAIADAEGKSALPVSLSVASLILVLITEELLAAGRDANPGLSLDSRAPAYVMYTSGSTGMPKGVVVPHLAIGRLTINNGYADFNATDRAAFAANPAFDATTMEVWAPLVNGGCIVVVRQRDMLEPLAFARVIAEQGVTVLFVTTAIFNQYADLIPHAFSGLRYLLTGGERNDPVSFARVLQQGAPKHLIHCYGPTETTTYAITNEVGKVEENLGTIPLGRPIANTRVYLLDKARRPVPVGIPGELYIGGLGVACGYLNRPELTAERFLPDPFAPDDEVDARMYKTGDLGHWLPDGTIEFLGRNDFQVKIRGFRIEPDEIEAKLVSVPGVKEAVVLAREDEPGEKRLVAYYTAGEALGAETLRSALARELPDYMVPAAYVALPELPLTPNGKVDRKTLPAPEGEAFGARVFEAPIGEVEETLAAIWAELLKLEKIGRQDHFFELGGHSLLAVTLIERMREQGLFTDVRALFTTPTLAGLAAAIGGEAPIKPIDVPENRIPTDCRHITPDLLPLACLSQAEIEGITQAVPGGAANIQDIYPLAPLQEGIFFHYLLTQTGDAYLLPAVLAFDSRKLLDDFLAAMEVVIARHDVLRTAVLWKDLPQPVQVVLRSAKLSVTGLTLSTDHAAEELYAHMDPKRQRLDIRKAPIMQVYLSEDKSARRWLLGLLNHHLIMDHTSMEIMIDEVRAQLCGEAQRLPTALPFRNFVAQARLGLSREEHEAFFRKLLQDVDEPTAPFGLMDVQGDGSGIAVAELALNHEVALDLRARARALGVSAASICHLAWAMVLARLCGREAVVFGSVLFGRMQASQGADRVLGMFINTLPVLIEVGDDSSAMAVKKTHGLLAHLLHHEHAPLSLAQGCSAVASPAPLFTTLFNYRYSRPGDAVAGQSKWEGMEELYGAERSNYPLTLSVDDLGEDFSLTALVQTPIDPTRICDYMSTAITHLTQALFQAPETPVNALEVLPAAEQRQVLFDWNPTRTDYPRDRCVHELFEAQAAACPDAVAVIGDEQLITYARLNRRANQLAHRLMNLGVKPGDHVAIALQRSIELVIAELAVLKCAAAYVPLDPDYPGERLAFMLHDAGVRVMIVDAQGKGALPAAQMSGSPVLVSLDEASSATGRDTNPCLSLDGRVPAYVMYTSGSTGTPKGVMVPHRAIGRLTINNGYADFNAADRVAFAANPAFDAATLEVWAPLLNGGCIVVIAPEVVLDPARFAAELERQAVTVMWLTVGLFNQYADALENVIRKLRYLIIGGDALDPRIIARVLRNGAPRHLLNGYGPTETTTFAATHEIRKVAEGATSIPLGRPIANTRIYILDPEQRPAPIFVTGELYIAGAGVALGYLNRPELTAERFLPDPFAPDDEVDARMYKTGDLGRWLPDGTIEFLGRNDFQVKIRGFRIEPGEIEAKLVSVPGVKEAVVLAREDAPSVKRLVAYYAAGEALGAETLRSALARELPDYMVPAAYVALPELPLTPNGKVDRKALPAPEGEAFEARVFEAPQGEVEATLAAIWAELLKLEKIGRQDHFFELGGHSLLAVTLMERIRQAFGVSLELQKLFSHPTIASFGECIVEAQLGQYDPEALIELMHVMKLGG